MKRPVALVGVGGIAQAHLQGWAEQPDAEITLLCDVNPATAEERRQRYGLTRARIVTDYDEVLASDIELVDLCTPSFLHAEQSIAALRAGKHVLCEKPMADTLADAERIAAAAAAAPDRVYLCEHRQLFDPLVVAVRQELKALGRVFWFRFRGAHALALSPTIKQTGAFLDMGYHPLYTALHFLGPAERVFAVKRQAARPDVVDDNGLYVIEHAGGGTSVLESSFSSIGPAGGTRPIELFGTTGTLIGNFVPRASLTRYLGEQGGEVPKGEAVDIPAGSWAANAVRHFLDVVDGKSTPLSGPEAALETMRCYDAALRSVQSGRSEPVRR